MLKHIFLKFHEKNEDYPHVASTMAAHENIAKLGISSQFTWGQMTTRRQSGISAKQKIEIKNQLANGETTYVYFYSRIGEVLYRAELINVYDNNESAVYDNDFRNLVPSYYRHLCGQTQFTTAIPSIIYAYFRVKNLELLAEGKVDVEDAAEHILHYDRSEPILTIKGMQALLYVSDQGIEQYLNQVAIAKVDSTVKKKKVIVVSNEIDNKKTVDEIEGANEESTSGETRAARKIDHKEANKNKHSSGLISERLVVDFEKENLIRNGRADLALKVEHISQEHGDGDGYDILSFNLDESPKYIEVKGTKNKRNTQFFITSAEVRASEKYGDSYYLYRVFDLESVNPSICIYRGDANKHFNLTPYTYIAR
ncbi:DUF3883 domain-containing protein [Lysinibacillus xylanilyticus]|uniref:DUF3883 domain-containing protein n=1 Tax=Lysinibacillus xylanilyticus TaxID=582475 RepID=UPI0038052DE0